MIGNLQVWVKRVAMPLERAFDAPTHERRRLGVLFIVALFKLLNFFGGTWDIQWHVLIGRDSLWIPPHLMVMVAFTGGITIAYFWILYETSLLRAGKPLPHTVQIGPFRAAAPFFGVFAGYAGALLSGVFDEAWHEIFGIDSTLWSPPHLCIMASTMFVDLSLMIGISTIARRLGAKLEWRSPLLWGLALTGAYTFEAVNFQMSQAFVEGYRAGGVAMMGILYPVLVAAMFPFPLLLNIHLARRFGLGLVLFAVAIVLQYVGTGIAAAGFAILRPESGIEEFVRLNPDSSIAQARDLISSMGFTGLIGFEQAWAMGLSFIPLLLVSLLDRVPWAQQRPLVAAPVFSVSLVLVSALWFRQMPVLGNYPVNWLDVALGVVISATIGLVSGSVGLRLARLAADDPA